MNPVIRFQDQLYLAHERITQLMGEGVEPLAVFQRTEEHRAYWRPDSPRVILLAESHVYTTIEELRHELRPQAVFPEDLPRGFVRLVYCLGYGEDSLLNRPIAGPRNAGTWQYWKIFHSCVNGVSSKDDFSSILSGKTSDAMRRLQHKLNLLETMKNRGVWLLDASLAALYSPNAPKPSPRLRKAVIEASWDTYIERVIQAAQPEAILCIGIGVGRTLQARLNRLRIPFGVVHQPQAHLSAEAHRRILATYSLVCENPKTIADVHLDW